MQYTYDTLLASCQNYCIDNSTQYEAEFPNIVQLASMRIIKDLNLSVFDTSLTRAMTADSPDITKPDDFIALQDFFVIPGTTGFGEGGYGSNYYSGTGSGRKYIQARSKSYLDNYWPNSSDTGQPVYYAENTTTLWQVVPTPDENYGYQINYIARPIAMTSANQNTWIGDKLGECLLPATLTYSMIFFREDVVTEQGATKEWEQAYELAIAQAKAELYSMNSAKDNVLTKITNTK